MTRITHEITMPTSISILNIKMGMVILVGKAARLGTSVIAIDAVANMKKARLFPVNITIATVNGVRMQP
ncbi:MAG TPA: hypothetical protein VEV87_01015 [Chitinophagaceae bacterium]|nr:hypothetical protein [Chitinophagaceae bacterium]